MADSKRHPQPAVSASNVLGGGQNATPASGGLGGLASMLDMDGDGNPLDDIMGMAAKFAR